MPKAKLLCGAKIVVAENDVTKVWAYFSKQNFGVLYFQGIRPRQLAGRGSSVAAGCLGARASCRQLRAGCRQVSAAAADSIPESRKKSELR